MSSANPITPPSGCRSRAPSLLSTRSIELSTSPSPKRSPSLAIQARNDASPSVTFHELLNRLSPSPLGNVRKSKRALMVCAEEGVDPSGMKVPRRKMRASSLIGCASPKISGLRARRKIEKESPREGREIEGDARKKKRTVGNKAKVRRKQKESMDTWVPCSIYLTPDIAPADIRVKSIDCLLQEISDLTMWKNVAKSGLWFGLGSLFFLSFSFSGDFNFSVFSAISHLGIILLALAFFYDSFSKRQMNDGGKCDFMLKEEDILRAARVLVPVANLALAKTQIILSGEPLMTLKATPILFLGAKYGHLITLRRLLTTGFFLGFTAPKLCSLYSQQICQKIKSARRYVEDVWSSCPHKKVVVASTAFAFWNFFSLKMRIFAAFICLVIFRVHKNLKRTSKSSFVTEDGDEEQQQTTSFNGGN